MKIYATIYNVTGYKITIMEDSKLFHQVTWYALFFLLLSIWQFEQKVNTNTEIASGVYRLILFLAWYAYMYFVNGSILSSPFIHCHSSTCKFLSSQKLRYSFSTKHGIKYHHIFKQFNDEKEWKYIEYFSTILHLCI